MRPKRIVIVPDEPVTTVGCYQSVYVNTRLTIIRRLLAAFFGR
jgi:hypothetical protein